MDVTFAIDRLKANVAGLGIKSIAGAAALDAVDDNTIATPSLIVVPLAESAEPNSLVGATSQRITQAFGVVFVVSNLRDVAGAAAAQTLAPLRLAVRAALTGWAPLPENGEQISFTSGRLLSFGNGRLIWADDFALRTYFRAV